MYVHVYMYVKTNLPSSVAVVWASESLSAPIEGRGEVVAGMGREVGGVWPGGWVARRS